MKYNPKDHVLSAGQIKTLIDLGIISSAAEYHSLPDWVIMSYQEEFRKSLNQMGPGKELGYRGAYSKGSTDAKN